MLKHVKDVMQVRVVDIGALLLMALIRCEQKHLVISIESLLLLRREMLELFGGELAYFMYDIPIMLLRISHPAFVSFFGHLSSIDSLRDQLADAVLDE